MVIVVVNGKKYFDDNLLWLIQSQNNVAAISLIKNVQVRRLTDSNGATLLHYAALHNNPVIAEHLIKHNCKVNATDERGYTPLMFAAKMRSVDTVKILLKANAKIVKLSDENFLLRSMINKTQSDIEIIESVFAKITSRCSDNNDIVQKLIELECLLPEVIFLNNAELTKLMLDRGCSLNDRLPISNETALHVAVELFDTDNIRVLVDHGADMNATDSDDRTPLNRFRILSSGDSDEKLDVLRFLLDRGASLEHAPVFAQRILSEGDIRTISVLMPYLDLTLNYENRFFPLHVLAENENDDIVDLLLRRNFDVNARDDEGYTALDQASDFKRVRMVQFLLERGADPNNVDHEEGTALSFIMGESLCESEKTRRIVELFLQYGANAQFLRQGELPLINAGTEDKFVLVQPILAHLAMIESFGEALLEDICKEIEASRTYKNYFEACKLQIELMKKTIMYESVTLYSLLSECKERIAIFSRIHEFVSNYELLVKNNKYDIDSYYISTIRLRVDKTLDLVQMKERVAGIVCEMMNLPYSLNDPIGHEIVQYLLREDLENMLQIGNTYI